MKEVPPGGPVLITGGCGFIGANLANRLLGRGESVRLFDNLSRPGVERNLRWLDSAHGAKVELIRGDARDAEALEAAVAGVSAVFHCAAQVAVTNSLQDPVEDFEVNARGTLNLLEALRRRGDRGPVIFTSTNKLYGSLQRVGLAACPKRYVPVEKTVRYRGINEEEPLEFCSPYGCSKGAADQYLLDYARSFGIATVVFRMSCIYGPHQFGTEDQGWVAYCMRQVLRGLPITVYGDGRQVRDILYIEDLLDALETAWANAATLAGRVFNIGGGPDNTISLLELFEALEELMGKRANLQWDQWRTGDQRYYVSDYTKFESATGWVPHVSVKQGLKGLLGWLEQAGEEAP